MAAIPEYATITRKLEWLAKYEQTQRRLAYQAHVDTLSPTRGQLRPC